MLNAHPDANRGGPPGYAWLFLANPLEACNATPLDLVWRSSDHKFMRAAVLARLLPALCRRAADGPIPVVGFYAKEELPCQGPWEAYTEYKLCTVQSVLYTPI